MNNLLKDQKIINEINIRLPNIFMNCTDELKKLMNKNNIYLSGLFLLECISDEDFPEKEIDFFVTENKFKKLNDFLKKNDFRCKRMSTSSHIGSCAATLSVYMPNELNIVHKQNNYCVNVLKIKEPMILMEQWLDKNVDFDICKNFYKINSSVEIIYIKSFDQIMNKSPIFRFSETMGSVTYKQSIEKYIKFQNLGFNFLDKGENMYNYIINSAFFTDKLNVQHKIYYNFTIKRVGKIKHVNDEGKKLNKYIFELVHGNLEDLEKNLFISYGDENKTIVKHENIVIENNKIIIASRLIHNRCKKNKFKFGIHNYCALNLCGIEKEHFHCLGTNVICCCVRTFLTFFISQSENTNSQ